MKKWLLACLWPLITAAQKPEPMAWIRINQLGYTTAGIKGAVLCSKQSAAGPQEPGAGKWQLVDVITKKTVATGSTGKSFGAYGPFTQTYRLDFSSFSKPGRYYLQAGEAQSPEFRIGDDVYKGAADFCLRYMRQQRSGFNPFLKDSCHTHDGYTLYGEKAGLPDSTFVDVSGGWHDASDYLQYSSTSANATYHLLMAYRDFPQVFADEKAANGLDGGNGLPDVLDEAKWGLDWLLKMHPRSDRMFNQLGDDRDHMGMRIPKEDSFYGRGYERPVYFVSGEPQQRGKFMNNTTGTSSTAGKFASVFALAHTLYCTDSLFKNADRRGGYYDKAFSAFQFGMKKKGVTQTASVRSPYIYAEDNWTDDMELAAVALHTMLNHNKGSADNGYYLGLAAGFAKQEKITPWLGADTARHYQWYPFINIGHYELIKELKTRQQGPQYGTGYTRQYADGFRNNLDTITGYYKTGIEQVWRKAAANAFYRGIPYIWCSNNLTVSFAIQCYWYRQLTGDKKFAALEQANVDWIFGCNPWGTSMVYGLPSWGDTPADPHSAFTHIKKYPVDGGLVDGPVYGSIYKNLIGITLYNPDAYALFQSDLAVYHDDYGDYSTNEPTMDGTASLIYLLASREAETRLREKNSYNHGAIIRGDSSRKNIALVFTGDAYAEGGDFIAKTLKQEKIKASFFFTGRFFRNTQFTKIIVDLKNDQHYLAPHSDEHLLYCDWNKRDSLLVSKQEFTKDLLRNYSMMSRFGLHENDAPFFLPPYEWYNDSIAAWTRQLGFRLISYTPGTLSHADYTTDQDPHYRSNAIIYDSILDYEKSKPSGLNGFVLLMHIGAGPGRTEKFYKRLPELIKILKLKGYHFQRVDHLLSPD